MKLYFFGIYKTKPVVFTLLQVIKACPICDGIQTELMLKFKNLSKMVDSLHVLVNISQKSSEM